LHRLPLKRSSTRRCAWCGGAASNWSRSATCRSPTICST
jgi:hypothetical protein